MVWVRYTTQVLAIFSSSQQLRSRHIFDLWCQTREAEYHQQWIVPFAEYGIKTRTFLEAHELRFCVYWDFVPKAWELFPMAVADKEENYFLSLTLACFFSYVFIEIQNPKIWRHIPQL